jgi:hypothetical protein
LGAFAGQITAVTLGVWFLGWCFKLVIKRNWFRGHYTQVVFTTALASLLVWFTNTTFSAPTLVIGGLLALAIRTSKFFLNRPPLEDEEENG